MRRAALVLAVLTLTLTRAHADDALRRSSVFVEGEDFAPAGPGWSPGQGWNDDIYSATSGDAVLGNNGDQGEAKREVSVPAAGTYQVWALYLKIGEYPGTFGLRIEQGGQVVFDQRYRTKPEGGDWRPVWESFPAELRAGPATLTVYLAQPGIRQRLDCVLLTPRADYKPDYHDFAPQVFCRYRVIEPAAAVVPSVDTYLHRAPVYYYAPGAWTAKGFDGAGEPVPAGSWSPWVDLSRYLDSGKWLTTVKLRFLAGGKPVERVKVELQVAPEADEAQAKSFTEDLQGELVTLVLPGDLRKYPDLATTASRLSARHLADVKALGLSAPPPPGRIPLELWVCGWGSSYHAPSVLADELGAARQLGATSINDLHGPARTIAERLGVRRQFFSQWLPYQAWACPSTDKLPRMMDEHFAKLTADIKQADPDGLRGLYRNILWDEPGTSDLKHLGECPSCLAAFRAFLKAQGLAPAALGAADWDAAKPIAREQATDGLSRRLHVQSIAFRDRTNAELVRAARLAAEKHFGAGVLQSVNFTDGALSGWEAGMVHGPDWFLYGRTQAASLLWSEDWASLGPEVSGYIVDMLRAAARPHRLAVGEYIICNHLPTLEQRAFSALAHGAKILHFYCYGPYYAFADGMVSDSAETQKALARTLRGIAAADGPLAAAAQPRAAAAILYGKSHEIWQADSAVGTERRTMYLACAHAHVPVDMVGEDDVAEGGLRGYRALFLTESNVRRDAARAIANWVRAGGVLQMSPGSGLRDEFDEPLGELTELAGVTVAKVDKPGGDYREHHGIPHTTPRGELKLAAGPLWPESTFPLLGYAEEAAPAGAEVLASFADGKPAVFRRQVGRGTVLRFCFMPGLGYVKSASPPATAVITGYHPEQLPLLTAALTMAKVGRPVEVSEPLVEARRLPGPQADALVLVNWSGKELPAVTVTVHAAAAVKAAESTRGARWRVARKSGDLTLTGPLAAAEVVVLRH